MSEKTSTNVLGGDLEVCGCAPTTGFFRDGFCRTTDHDMGRHVVCAVVTQEFLEYSASRGNDLATPSPAMAFPGLKPGDKWCLCASRWLEAYAAGCAPPVLLKATDIAALEVVSLAQLSECAIH